MAFVGLSPHHALRWRALKHKSNPGSRFQMDLESGAFVRLHRVAARTIWHEYQTCYYLGLPGSTSLIASPRIAPASGRHVCQTLECLTHMFSHILEMSRSTLTQRCWWQATMGGLHTYICQNQASWLEEACLAPCGPASTLVYSSLARKPYCIELGMYRDPQIEIRNMQLNTARKMPARRGVYSTYEQLGTLLGRCPFWACQICCSLRSPESSCNLRSLSFSLSAGSVYRARPFSICVYKATEPKVASRCSNTAQ